MLRRHSIGATLLALHLAVGCGGVPTAPTITRDDAALEDAGVVHLSWDAAVTPSCEQTCLPAGPCEAARCVAEQCVRALRDDGSSCEGADTHVCVAGECRVRGCGDGWREPGSAGWPREGCDPGAVTPFCDPACMPIVGTLVALPNVSASDVAVGVDGGGRALLLSIERTDDAATLWAHTFDRHLASSDEPFAIARLARPDAPITPAVQGLPAGGWAIAYVSEPDGIAVTVVHPGDHAPGAPVPWIEGVAAAERPAIAAIATEFVVVATDLDGTGASPLGGVRARIFDASGAPRGLPVDVALEPSALATSAVVAGQGGSWTTLYTTADVRAVRLWARPFTGRAPDSAASPLGTATAFASGTSIVDLGHGTYGAAWIESDEAGSMVRSAVLTADGGVVRTSTAAGVFAETRTLAFGVGELGVLANEAGPAGRLRPVDVSTAPPELSRLFDEAPRAVRWGFGSTGSLAVWLDASTGAVRAFLLAPSAAS